METYQLLEDSKGYIWISSDHGVSRFDGRTFENFSSKDGMPENVAFHMYEDSEQRIWFTNLIGDLFYLENKQFFPVNLKEEVPGLHIRTLSIGENDSLHAFSTIKDFNFRVRYHHPSQTLKVTPHPEQAKQFMFGYEKLPGGKLIYGFTNFDRKEVIRYPRYEQTQESIYPLKNYILTNAISRKIAPNSAFTVIQTESGDYLMTCGSSVLLIRGDTIHYRKPVDFLIYAIKNGKDNRLWACTDRGIARVFIREGQIEFGQFFLENQVVHSALEDREGHLWCTTRNGGLFKLNVNGFFFFPDNEYLNNHPILHLANRDDVLLIESPNQICQIPKSEFSDRIEIEEVSPFTTGAYHDITKLENRIGWAGEMVGRYDLLKDYLNLPIALRKQIHYMPGIHFLGQERIIMNASRTLFISKSNAKLSQVNVPDYATNFIQVSGIGRLESACMDEDQQIFLGSARGLYTLNEEREQVVRIDGHPFFRQKITGLVVDSLQNIWMCARGGGVLYWNRKKNSYHHIPNLEGLSSDLCNALEVQNDSQIWVGTNRGISRITIRNHDPFEYSTLALSTADGLPFVHVQDLEMFNEKLFIGSASGLSMLDPKELLIHQVPPNLVLKSMSVNDSLVAKQKTYTLSSVENTLEFVLNGISFRTAKEITYRYRLRGLSDQWKSSEFPAVRFTSLDPGKYQFEAVVEDKFGLVSEETISIQFQIVPHFTQTLWFTILLVTAGILVVTGICYLIFIGFIRRARAQRQILVSEQKALKAQMNPHFIFNMLNSIQYFIAKSDKKSAYVYMGKASALVRNILEATKSNFVTLEQEITNLQLYLEMENLRFEEKMNFIIRVTPEADERRSTVSIPTMVVQPFLENAIWHGIMPKGEPGTVELEISLKDDQLLIKIEDDGIGREKSMEMQKRQNAKYKGTSTGMKNVENRLKLINRIIATKISLQVIDLKNVDGAGIGTKVLLTLPVNAAKYENT